MSGHDTGYAETEILLHVMDDDETAALSALSDMTIGERVRLLGALEDLAKLIRSDLR